jgi:LysR family hydrogen peroxide-inducible transcriptional activator
MISLKQLNYALAVAKTLHFKKAAEACSVSQSAMSTAINEMEKLLGFQVFERNNKQVLITSQGELFLKKAQVIKLEMEELTQLSQLNDAELSAPMKMGVIPTIGPYLLPKVLPSVRAQYPNFKLQIVEEQSHVLVDMVRQGDLDMAILALPFPIDGLMAFEFWQEDFYWISHQDECPSEVQEIKSNELELEKLMLLKDGHCLKDHALAACHFQKQDEGQEFASTSLHTLIQMVAGKMGTTLVPEMALDQLVKNNSEIRAVHLDEPGPHRRIAFILRPNYVRVNDLERLKTLFKEALNKAKS